MAYIQQGTGNIPLWIQSPIPPHPKGALLDCEMVTVVWCVNLLEVAIRKRVHCGHKGTDMVRLQRLNDDQLVLRRPQNDPLPSYTNTTCLNR